MIRHLLSLKADPLFDDSCAEIIVASEKAVNAKDISTNSNRLAKCSFLFFASGMFELPLELRIRMASSRVIQS